MKQIALLLFLLLPALTNADISFIAAETADSATNGDITVNVPASTADGDAMLACYWNVDNATTDVSSTGWTRINLVTSALGQDSAFALFYRVADNEPASYDFDNTGSTKNLTTATIATFRGVVTPSPLDVEFVEADHWVKLSNDSTPLPNPITTNTPGAWVFLCSHSGGDTVVTDVVPPTGYTERSENINNHRYQMTATKEVASAGTETPGDITLTGSVGSEETNIYTVALKPASAPLSFTSAPALNGCDATTCTFDATPSANATWYGAAYTTGASAPADCDAVQAGVGAEDTSSKAVTGADTLTLDSTLIEQDYYFCLDDTVEQSTTESVLNQQRDPRTGYEFVTLDSVSATSCFADPSPCNDDSTYYIPAVAPGDIVEAVSATDPGGFTITWETDGDYIYTDAEESCQKIAYCLQDTSDATGEFATPDCWTNGDDKILINCPIGAPGKGKPTFGIKGARIGI